MKNLSAPTPALKPRLLFIVLIVFGCSVLQAQRLVQPTQESESNQTELSTQHSNSASQPSIKDALNEDGTFRAGAAGSFDVSGYSMSYGPKGEPVFRATAGAGDERWGTIQQYTGLNGNVTALYSDGLSVYIGGSFTNAGGNPNADYIAVYSGGCWGALGTGLNGPVNAIERLGVNIYVGGNFTNAAGNANIDYIAVWDGEFWNALNTGLNQIVHTIKAVGSLVYVGGAFTNAGSIASADGIASWNGTDWAAVGSSGTPSVGSVYSMDADDLGVLYVGGSFLNMGGNANADYIARWNGTSWLSMGTGLTSAVYAVAVQDFNVYVGGLFDNAGGIAQADYIARWDGSNWNSLGGITLDSHVSDIAVNGSDVFIAGSFSHIDGNTNMNGIALWDGSSYWPLETGLGGISALFESGTGVYIGGNFTDAGGHAYADRLVEWGNQWPHIGWIPFSSGIPSVYTVAVQGNDIYVGGDFFAIDGTINTHGIVKWDGTKWTALASGVGGAVYTIEIAGSNVYVGGSFGSVGGNVDINSIAVWNGNSWSGVGLGVQGVVHDILVNGTDVYICGEFDFPERIARWNGSNWFALGTGLNATARSMVMIGTDLYVGGDFTNAGGNASADYVARWNGSSWNALGSGLTASVWALAARGTDLYVGGNFENAGGVANADYIARWSGSSWNALGTGMGLSGGRVRAITVSGSNLYVGGRWFPDVAEMSNIAVWNGLQWNSLGTGLRNLNLEHVSTIVVQSDKAYVGGEFVGTGDESVSASNIIVRNAVFPDAYSVAASGLTATQVRLNGTVNARGGASGTYRFEWGTSAASLTNLTTAQSMSGTANTAVSADISPGVATIYYRVRSQNIEGASYSEVMSYTFPSDIEVRQAATPIASGGEYNFGNVNQSTSSSAISFAVHNLGLGSLTLSGSAGNLIVKGGAHASDFTVVQTAVTSPIAYNANRAFTVQFTPSAGGLRTATLTITSNDPDEGTYVVNLRGNGMLAQTITFNALPVKVMGEAPFNLTGTASSSLAVSYASATPTVATISGNTVTIVGPGTTVITASQAGNTTYNAAPEVQQTLTVRAAEPTTQASNLVFSAPTVNGLTVSWTNGNGAERLVVVRQGSAVNVDPVDGTAYTGNANFTAATDLGSGNKVAFRGTGSSVALTNLTANIVYHVRVYELNGTAALTNYMVATATNNPSSRTTLQTEPTAQPGTISFTNITTSSHEGSFAAATGSPSGYLIVRRQGSTPTGLPVDGTAYTAGNPLGDGTVVQSSVLTTFSDAGLVAGTVYHYRVFSFNGAAASINYRTTSPTTNSLITISSAPVAEAATTITQTSFTANWTAITGAASYVLDVSLDNFSNLITGYANKTVTGTSDAVTGLTPGVTYQYRVRASNASGLSSNSNTISQITVPATPVADAVTTPGATSFTASWNTIDGATGYQLDVSTNNFVTYLIGYQSRAIPAGTTTELVSPLSASTQYQYRVRAVNAAPTASPNSNVVIVTTVADGPALSLSSVSSGNLAAGQNSVTITVEATGGVGAKTVQLMNRKIKSTSAYAPLAMTNTGGSTYSVALPATALDEIGAEFYIRATDATTAQPQTTIRYVYRPVPENTSIPDLSFGGELKNYRIISIPYKLDQPNTSTVFSSMGAFDKTKWRLVQYDNGAYKDQTGSITLGKSYWFNAREQTTIELSTGTVAQNNLDASFTMNLKQGWNMIATPYPFAISWDDVLDHNTAENTVGEYLIFSGTGYSPSDNLEPFKGGFVHANQDISLTIPVTINNQGNRVGSETHALTDTDPWLVPISIKNGATESNLHGIGMHREAVISKDRFDRISMPKFFETAELTTHHDDFISSRFIRDVVPVTDTYVWSFELESETQDAVTIGWDITSFKQTNAQLLLYDREEGKLINMRSTSSYRVAGSRTLEFIYSKDERYVVEQEIGRAHPNPFNREVTLPAFLNTTADNASVALSIVSMTGTEVYRKDFQGSAYEIIQPQWDGTDRNGTQLPQGVYIYKVTFRNAAHTQTRQGKILKASQP